MVSVEYTETYRFYIDGDGVKERVGWIAADDGQFEMDHDGNGTIDDDYDYDNLLVWRDLNQDGISEGIQLKILT